VHHDDLAQAFSEVAIIAR